MHRSSAPNEPPKDSPTLDDSVDVFAACKELRRCIVSVISKESSRTWERITAGEILLDAYSPLVQHVPTDLLHAWSVRYGVETAGHMYRAAQKPWRNAAPKGAMSFLQYYERYSLMPGGDQLNFQAEEL